MLPDASPPEKLLLAVDLGLRTGFAWYRADGTLRAYRSQNYGARARLKRAAHTMLREARPAAVVLEGGGDLAEVWRREAEREGARVLVVQAGVWRRALLLDREQRSGPEAKAHADTLARRVIAWSGAPRPTSLRHDAAEAILVGLWGVLEMGWLDALPDALRAS